MLGNKASSQEEGRQKILSTLRDGSAMVKFKEMIQAQGVDKGMAERLCKPDGNFYDFLPLSSIKTEIKANASGVITSIDALMCAEVTSALGAGRSKPGEPVMHDVGILLQRHVGDNITAGDALLTVYHRNEKLGDELVNKIASAVTIDQVSTSPDGAKSRFLHRISSN